MRNVYLMAGLVATAIGLSAVSTGSAFAMGCLTNQENLPGVSLTNNPMVPNEGFGYDKTDADAAIAKGNTCSTTEQSQAVSDIQSPDARSHARPNVSDNN
jgi:hypothetical protein